MTDKITLEVDQDGLTGKLQLSINERDEKGTGWGYRLHGPKFNGSGKNLLEHDLTQADADEIRKYLDKAFEPPKIWSRETVGSWSEAYATRQLAMDSLAKDFLKEYSGDQITWRRAVGSEDVPWEDAELEMYVDGEAAECRVVSGRIITSAPTVAKED